MIDPRSWISLLEALEVQFFLGANSGHGPSHWRRVENFGLHLAGLTGADPDVVRLFSIFHDAGRVKEDNDPGHGTRGAALAASFHRRGFLNLDRARLYLLMEACDTHTVVIHHRNPTIATCFDADRLDLTRYGMHVDPDLLNSDAAKQLALNATALKVS